MSNLCMRPLPIGVSLDVDHFTLHKKAENTKIIVPCPFLHPASSKRSQSFSKLARAAAKSLERNWPGALQRFRIQWRAVNEAGDSPSAPHRMRRHGSLGAGQSAKLNIHSHSKQERPQLRADQNHCGKSECKSRLRRCSSGRPGEYSQDTTVRVGILQLSSCLSVRPTLETEKYFDMYTKHTRRGKTTGDSSPDPDRI